MPHQDDQPDNCLHIDFQDGFEGELVTVTVDGQEVYRQGDVKTDYRIGLATSVEVGLPDHPVTVRVSLPQKGADLSLAVEPEPDVYLAVSYLDGDLQSTRSPRPFGYV